MGELSETQFIQWKDIYWNIYYVEIDEEEFIFRELSRFEYKRGLRLITDDESSLEEYICATCVLEPEDYDFEACPAGIPSSLAAMILYESGFTEDTGKLTTYMNKYRKEMQTLDNQMACIIKEAFPELNIEQIELWPMEKTIWYYSRAEYILRTLRGVDLTIETAGAAETDAHQAPVAPSESIKQDVDQAPPKERKFDFEIDGDGGTADFPELGEIQAFMKGKWTPPPGPEGEELI